MNIWQKWNSISLVKRILVGLVIGAILGFCVPAGNEVIALLGDLFVGALKAVAPVLVFFLVISALANAKSAGSMGTVIVLYIVSTLVAALIAVCASYMFPTVVPMLEPAADQASPEGLGEVLTTLLMNVVANPVGALMNANYLGILAWGVVLGIALRAASQHTKDVFTAVSDAISKVVSWIISFAPIGILGLVYVAVSENGAEIFITYGHLIAVLVGCMLFIALVTNPLIVFIATRKNPYYLVLRCLKDSGITAFFTRSSAANIPVNMELCRKLGLNKDNYSVSIPLGATINMDGTSIMQGVAVVFVAQAFGITLTPADYLTVIATATLASIGTAGVPSVGLITLAMVFDSVGLPVAGIGLIMGIDRILDMARTAVNITGDAVCTTIVAHQDGALDKSVFNKN